MPNVPLAQAATPKPKSTPAACSELKLIGKADWSSLEFWSDAEVPNVEAGLTCGANIEAKGVQGWTPIHQAIHAGQNPAVPLALLAAGADIEAKNNDGWTLFHVAAWHHNTSALRALLEAGADVNARNNGESTPLSLAGVMGDEAAVWELREAGGTR